MVRFGVELKNHEAEAIEGKVSAKIAGDSEESIRLCWLDETDRSTLDSTLRDARDAPVASDLPLISTTDSHRLMLFGQIPPQPVKVDILVTLEYSLASDKQTSLRKTLTIGINAVVPFEAKFNFGPLLFLGPWPSYFDPELGIANDQPSGISQLWRLGSLLRSHANGNLVVHDIKPVVEEVVGDSHARPYDLAAMKELTFAPGQTERFTFEILTQEESIDDRRPTGVDSALAIIWSRSHENADHATTHLPIPRLTLPVSEPRVLCTIDSVPPEDDFDALLSYHIENPSTHFLTFAVTMEATEDFAFSGPKFRTLSLAPLSRYKVEYRITLQEAEDGQSTPKASTDGDGRWIWPELQVVDSYYQKTLRVNPGGKGVRFGEKQNIGVLIPAP
jgi:solute carrier family 25 protein 38